MEVRVLLDDIQKETPFESSANWPAKCDGDWHQHRWGCNSKDSSGNYKQCSNRLKIREDTKGSIIYNRDTRVVYLADVEATRLIKQFMNGSLEEIP